MSMTTYEIIDTFCDAINPILLLGCLVFCADLFLKKEFKKGFANIFLLLLLMVFVYGLKLMDDQIQLWPRIGGDYSTHTAFALVCCAYLFQAFGKPLVWAGILTGYVVLMWFQQYHTLFDMLTTGLVMGASSYALFRFAPLKRRASRQ